MIVTRIIFGTNLCVLTFYITHWQWQGDKQKRLFILILLTAARHLDNDLFLGFTCWMPFTSNAKYIYRISDLESDMNNIYNE